MKNLSGLRILITGGAGFIGSHLVDKLVEQDSEVRVLDNLVNGKIENLSNHLGTSKFEFMKGSVTDPLDMQRAVKGIDLVFHLACLGVRHSIAHPFENHRVNAEGALLLLDAARRADVQRFVYCSSSEVYGTAEYVPMPESHSTHPCTIYGASKLTGEAYARAYYTTYGMPTIILRPFNTYGPRSHHEGDSGEMIPKSIVRALNDQPIIIFGDGSQTRDFTYVEDTARAMAAAAECDDLIGQTVNIGSSFEISIKDLAIKILQKISNSEIEIEYMSDRPGDVLRLYADCSKFNDLTGWKPQIDINEGLNRTIDFFKNHPLGLKKLMEIESGRNWEEAY